MWYQASQQIYSPSSPSKLGATDPDAHAHSPRRRNAPREINSDVAGGVMPPRLLSQSIMPPPTRPNAQLSNSNWATGPHVQEYAGGGHKPPVPRRWGTHTTHMSTSDESMPDYSYSITPRSSRDPSLNDVHEVHDGSVAQHESQFEELMAAFSPAKTSGTQAPPTTRVSSAANSPPSRLPTSGGPEVRITSYHSLPRAVSVTTRDAPPPPLREPSVITMESRFPEPQAGEKGITQTRIRATPANEVKGRKEGKGSELDASSSTRQQKMLTGSSSRRQKSTPDTVEERNISTADDGKRKRASMTSISNILSENSDGPGSSPSRKVSKKGQLDGLGNSAGSSISPQSVVRAPLGSLHNIR